MLPASVLALCLSTCSELRSLAGGGGALLGQLRFLDTSNTKFIRVPEQLSIATRLEMLAMRECLQLQLDQKGMDILLSLPKLTTVWLCKEGMVGSDAGDTWNSRSQQCLLHLHLGLSTRQPPGRMCLWGSYNGPQTDFCVVKRKLFHMPGPGWNETLDREYHEEP